MIVVAVIPPRTGRDIAHLDKLPVGHIGRLQPKIISDRGRNIETRAAVQIRLRPLVLKNVLKVVGAERPAIFPLRIANTVAFADRDPAILADRLALARYRILLEPRNDQRGFRFELAVRDIVIRQRDVKRILTRDEIDRDIVAAIRAIRGVVAAITAKSSSRPTSSWYLGPDCFPSAVRRSRRPS